MQKGYSNISITTFVMLACQRRKAFENVGNCWTIRVLLLTPGSCHPSPEEPAICLFNGNFVGRVVKPGRWQSTSLAKDKCKFRTCHCAVGGGKNQTVMGGKSSESKAMKLQLTHSFRGHSLWTWTRFSTLGANLPPLPPPLPLAQIHILLDCLGVLHLMCA